MALRKWTFRSKLQRGMSLVELLVAMTVLMIGVTGCVCVIPFTIKADSRSKKVSHSTAIAQMVMEKIMSVPAGTNPVLNLADCAGNNPTINTAGTAGGVGATLANSGDADYTQAQGAIAAGYAMNWTTCATAGQAITYDVRWRIVSPDNMAKIITVSAKSRGNGDGIIVDPPATIRSVVGQ